MLEQNGVWVFPASPPPLHCGRKIRCIEIIKFPTEPNFSAPAERLSVNRPVELDQ
jgi:hypothetical protein